MWKLASGGGRAVVTGGFPFTGAVHALFATDCGWLAAR